MSIDYRADDFNIRSFGSFYSEEKTVFRVFAPDYEQLDLILDGHAYAMHRKGLSFEIALKGNLELKRYHYMGDGISFKDPFSYLSRGRDSIVLDESRFLDKKVTPKPFITPVIYECSVRDFSSDASYSGSYKGTFLAFTESGLKSSKGNPIGLDHLKNLGISHLQLMPIFDFDEDRADYNWGYNPLAYNYVKSDYVLHDNDPYAHINELRHMVNVLHQNDIRVVLDVVFNHVYRYRNFDLGRMLKGRAYRFKADGSIAEGTYCGNEIRSEDPFVRAYIVEMVERYLRLFDIDGIRMDLMGISDIDTVNLIYQRLTEKKKDFMVYGEGWNMGDVLDEKYRASIDNVSKLPHIAMFNDRFRETIIHFVSGNDLIDDEVEQVLNADPSYLSAKHSINYVECHDDYTFYDRMMIYKDEDHGPINEKRSRMAMALVMIAKGIPFIHSGQEFLRTKNGIRNSYNSGDEVNKMDWDRLDRYHSSCKYLSDLIALRKEHPCLSDPKQAFEISRDLSCLILRVCDLVIYINQSSDVVTFKDEKISRIIFDDKGKCNQKAQILSVPPYCVMICKAE